MQSNMKWCEVSKAWRQAERSQMWKKLFDPVHANRGAVEFISERTRRLGFHFSDQRRHFSPSHRLWSSFRISKVISKGSLKGFFVSARLPLDWLKWKGARPGSAGHCCWIVFDVSAFTSKEAAPCPCSDTAGASARLSCTVVRIRTKHSMTQRKE